MSRTRELFLEALNPLVKVANSVVRKLNYVEASEILKTTEFKNALEYLDKVAGYHSNAYNELDDAQQQAVLERVWATIQKTLGGKKIGEATSEREELEQQIYTFLKSNGGILFPLENAAKKLADTILKKNKDAND